MRRPQSRTSGRKRRGPLAASLLAAIHLAAIPAATLCAPAAALPAQQPGAPAPQGPEFDAAAIQQRLDELKADAALEADLKTSLQETWGRALEAAKAIDKQRAAEERFEAMKAGAPQSLQDEQQALEDLDHLEPGPRGSPDLGELEKGLAAAQLQQSEISRAIEDLEKERARRTERRATVPGLLTELRRQLEAAPARVPDAEADPRLQTARRALRQNERARIEAEIAALTAELAAYEAEEELLRARRDLAVRRQTWNKANVDAWQAEVQRVRAEQAQRAAAETAERVETTDPRLVAIAAENAQLAETLHRLSGLLASAEQERTASERERARIAEEFRRLEVRVGSLGATNVAKALLRQRRAQLEETTRSTQQRSRNRRERNDEALLNELEFEERSLRLARDPERWLGEQLGGEQAVRALPAQVVDEARQLRRKRRELLGQLEAGFEQLGQTLDQIGTIERDITRISEQYRAFVAEHVLGIRSSPPLWNLDLSATAEQAGWLLEPNHWRHAGEIVLRTVGSRVWPVLALLPLLLLLLLGRWLRRRLAGHGEVAMRGTNVAYAPTALALVDTLLLALPLPLLLLVLGQLAVGHEESTEFGKALAAGAERTAPLLALLLLLRAVARPRGLAEAHFRWQPTTLRHLRRNMRILLPAAFPLTMLLAMSESHALDEGSLTGLLLAAILLLAAVAGWRILHPTTGILAGGLGRSTAPLHRFRRVWFALGFGAPVVLLLTTVLGFDYTALQLTRLVAGTVLCITAGVLLHGMIVRGLVLERRRLQIRRAQERLAAARAAEGGGAAAEAPEAPAAEEVDPQALARQTQTLLRGAITIAVLIAAYQIWADFLPALGALRRVDLWTVDDGETAVTLADLVLALLVLALGLAAASKLPALLELFVLQRLEIQAGERNAITTLARYGIVIAVVVLAFSAIGIGWSKVQWLVAAVSVGLGFGLQEIFANFVSGLILLFERPVRVGDLVSVGDVLGRVTRIRIRATTIQDWDRKELVVPNREFVTNRFVNWTLGDPVVRWTVAVGVAYGSDTQKALQLLQRAAEESPQVLRSPAPEVVFGRFGDSTLDLELRVYLDMNALDYRWRTELHQAIDRLFREHGIEIAFPQRDVHLKAAGPLLDWLQRGSSGAGAAAGREVARSRAE